MLLSYCAAFTGKLVCVAENEFNFSVNFKCMNWTVIIIVGIILVGLIVFLVRRNAKDEKEFEQQQNNDYHKAKNEEGDVDAEEKMK